MGSVGIRWSCERDGGMVLGVSKRSVLLENVMNSGICVSRVGTGKRCNRGLKVKI